MNIFEQASREKFRFQSIRGSITTELLWDMALKKSDGFDLDSVAKQVNAELKAETDESFVATKPNKARAQCEVRLEIVKHVIAVKLQEQEVAKQRVANAAKREKLLDILEDKQVEALKALSEEDLKKQIAELA